jgi:hypothetical protein
MTAVIIGVVLAGLVVVGLFGAGFALVARGSEPVYKLAAAAEKQYRKFAARVYRDLGAFCADDDQAAPTQCLANSWRRARARHNLRQAKRAYETYQEATELADEMRSDGF